jgi:hypothetical protein
MQMKFDEEKSNALLGRMANAAPGEVAPSEMTSTFQSIGEVPKEYEQQL